jgi:hypothetical protein
MAGKHDGADVWAKPDRLLGQRAVHSIVSGTKHWMTEWGWPRQALWADAAAGTVTLAGKIVLTVKVEGNELQTDYSEGWTEYFDDSKYPEVKELIKNAGDKITKGSGKGKDKGQKGTTLGY